MPETVTAYNTFVAGNTIFSGEVNTNFSNHRGTVLPIDPTTTAAVDQSYDCGNSDYRFKRTYGNPVVDVNTVTATYTVTTTDYCLLANAASADFTITLPGAASVTGMTLLIAKEGTDTNMVTIDGNGAETIDGTITTTLLSENDTTQLVSTGTKWISKNRFKNRFITTRLTADITSSQTVADWSTTLRIGKVYRVTGQLTYDGSSTTDDVLVQFKDGATLIVDYGNANGINAIQLRTGISFIFKATSASFTVVVTEVGAIQLRGNTGNNEESFITIEECNNAIEVSAF